MSTKAACLVEEKGFLRASQTESQRGGERRAREGGGERGGKWDGRVEAFLNRGRTKIY